MASQPTTPLPQSPANPVPPVSASIHGPYEDLAIEGMKLLQTIIQSQPPDVQQKLWNDFLTFITGLQSVASKIDVFHLFHASS